MTDFRQWGWFHSMAAAREAVDRLRPGRVRYERRGSGQVEVLVAVSAFRRVHETCTVGSTSSL